MIKTLTRDRLNEIFNNKENAAIKAFGNNCAPCKALKPIYESVSTKFPNIDFYEFNIEEDFKMASELQIMSIPSIVVVSNGKIKMMQEQKSEINIEIFITQSLV